MSTSQQPPIHKTRKYLQRVNFWSGLLLVFSLPFGRGLIPPLIILWILTWLIEGNYRNRFQGFSGIMLPFLLLIGLYIWHIAGLIYTSNIKSGLFDLEIKLSFLILPCIFIGLNHLYIEKRLLVLKAFILGNACAALICILHAVYFVFMNYGFENYDVYKIYFFYTRLSYFIHPSYFAMYLVFCLIIIEYFLYDKLIKAKFERIYYFICIGLFMLVIFMLSSRAGELSLFLLISGLMVIYLIKIKSMLFRGIAIIVISLLFVLLIFSPRIKMLVNNYNSQKDQPKQEIKYTVVGPESSDESSNVRLEIWKSALSVSSESILFGVGTGDIRDELNKEFVDSDNKIAIKNKLNVHNQFIETMMGQGIIGLLILIGLFIIGIKRSYNEKNRMSFLFILLIGFNFLFESMLNTQAGVVFICFFYCLLVLTKKNNLITT